MFKEKRTVVKVHEPLTILTFSGCFLVMLWSTYALWKQLRISPLVRCLRIIFFLCIALIFVRATIVLVTPIYPNQVFFTIVLLTWGTALLFMVNGNLVHRNMFSSGCIVYIYFVYMLATAMWAYYPEYTLDQYRFDWLNIIIYWLFYCLALNVRYGDLIVFFCVFPPIVFVWTLIYHLLGQVEFARLPGSFDVAMAVPFIAASLYGVKTKALSWSFIIISVVLLAVSKQKTAIGASLVGLVLSYVYIYPTLRNIKHFVRTTVAFTVIGLSLSIAVLMIPSLREMTFASVSRFGYNLQIGDEFMEGEKVDIHRENIRSLSRELLRDNWLTGIGYMNFTPISGGIYPIFGFTATKKFVFGYNIHNVFMTWALEGGLPCIIIVITMLFRYFSILRNKISNSKSEIEIRFNKAALICMVQLFVVGLFGQLHFMPEFWGMIGLVYAIPYRHNSNFVDRVPTFAKAA